MRFLRRLFYGRKMREERMRMLENEITHWRDKYEELVQRVEATARELDRMHELYPLSIGSIVYDLQLRGDNGRYTRTKASREHSLINEVVVDTKNYFKLVARMHAKDVFTSKKAAERELDKICVK